MIKISNHLIIIINWEQITEIFMGVIQKFKKITN